MASPRCYRCKVRSLECQYHHISTINPQPDSELKSDPQILANPVDIDEPSVDSSLSQIASNGDLSLQDPQINITLPAFPDYNLDWQDIMGSIQDFSVPDQIGIIESPSKSVLAGEIYQERIVYSVERLKSMPRLFAIEGQTPFIHKNLYEIHPPCAITDALAACALYTQKNEANQGLVYRSLSQQADRLVKNYASFSAIEQLASVQAMALLQIIRFFDGDIRQRADAEKIEPLFVEWIRHLQNRLQQLGDSESDSSGNTMRLDLSQTADTWQNWLYMESLRRTIIVGYTLQGLYCFLKNGWDESHHEFNSLSFYAQKALWSATSEFQWKLSLKEYLALPIRFNQWDADISNVTPMDIDELGMIMMALVKGVDYCSQWAGVSFVETFGLVS
ncbi:hypothetical protein N7520_003069 [Penicillium odoratum]|uniref:uncharacterized protein n=1 Tax=Penicillium odoratum TaxID=1167516 RepID=UPI0025499CAA|nr:uncharacterized protein N7520_003069 [Penicillium odoratum]KAJ5772540.1 hypothetical protein N7520_003069 [Penicillium odoratum]